MPNAGDPFLGSALPVTHSPLQRISFDPSSIVVDIGDILQTIVTWVEDFLFPAIKQLTGIDLGPFLDAIQSVITNLETIFGSLNPSSGTFDPQAAIQAFINLCIDLGISFPMALIQELGGFTSGIPILSQLISVLTGGNVDGSAGLAGLGSFFNFIPGVSNITEVIEGLIAEIPGVGPLIDTFLSFLTGTTSSGGTLGDLSSALGNIPLLGPLIEALTGGNLGAADGLAGLGEFFNFIPGATSLVDFIEQIVGEIPIAGPIIDTFLSFLLGTPTTGGTTDQLASALANIPLIGPLIESLTGGNVSGDAGLAGLANFFDFGTGFGTITAVIESVVGSIPIVGPMIDTFLSFLTGSPSSGGTLTELSGALGNIPLVGDLLDAFTGSTGAGGGGIGGLVAVIQDFMGIFGNIGGLGTGAVTVDSILSNIPILGPFLTWLEPVIAPLAPIIDPILGIFSMFGVGSGATGTFDWLGTARTFLTGFLTPAGALSTLTQIPGHLFGNVAPGNMTNLLPDPGFDNPDAVSGSDIFTWDGTFGRGTTPGSIKTMADGTMKQIVGVPIGAYDGQAVTLGIHAYWTGLVVTTGQAIVLAAEAYDNNDLLIPNPGGRVVNYIDNPSANSSSYGGSPTSQKPPVTSQDEDGNTNGWIWISGSYTPPAGTSYVRISPEIEGTVQAGTVWFDDARYLPANGFIDASWLTNWGNIGQIIPGDVIGGIQNIVDMVTAFQGHVDGLYNAFVPGSPMTDVPFTDLFDIAQQMASSALQSLGLSAANTNIINNQVNKSVITGGLQPSGEMNFTLSGLPDGTTMPTSTLATGNAMAGWHRVGQKASKGFIDLYASKASGASGIFVNLYKQDPTTQTKTRVWASSDVATVFNTTLGWAQVLIPGGAAVNANDILWVELVNNTGSNMTVGKRTIPVVDHPYTVPTNFGHTRTTTLGVSPASLTTAQATSSQTAPIFATGIAVVPADYHIPEQQTIPPAGVIAAGDYPYTIPTWIKSGDTLDLVGVGGGGSGQSEWDAGIMAGGLGGNWNGRRIVYGVDIPVGTTQLNCHVGAGGPNPGFYWADGNPGSDTVWTVLDGPAAGTELLRCTGGPGGSGSVGLSSGTGSAPSPNPYPFQGKSYPGGGNVGINSTGAAPGGGGGGATWFEFGGSGAPGGGWATAMKAAS